MAAHTSYLLTIRSIQLQTLVNEAVRLQEEYPGENAMQLDEQQSVMVADWNLLQERATERRSSLQAANDFHRLMATVRALPFNTHP